MGLKIVGRPRGGRMGRMEVAARGAAPTLARELAMQCDLCQKRCYAQFPFNPTREQRIRLMHAAMDEHRRVCTVGTPEDRRTYTLLYA